MRPSAQERDLILSFLSGNDPRFEKLRQQLDSAPSFSRERIGNSGYRLRPNSTSEDLLIELDEDVSSEAVQLTDSKSGRRLEFKLVLLRGGFLGYLEGRTTDETKWPRRWRVERIDLEQIVARPLLGLPDAPTVAEIQERIRDLEDWLSTTCRGVQVRRGAGQREIAQLEKREAIQLPEQLRRFFSITDGLDVGELLVFGSKDAYVLSDKEDARPLLVMARLEDGEEILAVDISQAELPVKRLGKHGPNWNLGEVIAPSFRDLIARVCSEGSL